MTKKPDIGTRIMFMPAVKGTTRGKAYQWIASANPNYPEVIFFNEHKDWLKIGTKRLMLWSAYCCTHETIHNVLWYKLDIWREYDVVRLKWYRKMLKKYTKKYANSWFVVT